MRRWHASRRRSAGTGAWLALLGLIVAGAATGHDLAARAPHAPRTCDLSRLPGLSFQFSRVRRQLSSLEAQAGSTDPDAVRALRAGLTGDLLRVVRAVVGGTPALPPLIDLETAGVGLASLSAAACEAGSRARDQVVWTMSLAGYSAREIGDVVAGHLTLADLRAARALAVTGQPRAAAEWLEARWRPERPPLSPPSGRVPTSALAPDLQRHVERVSRTFGVDPALVHAVIAAESGGNPAAVSPAGAIGLMQLMPATAAALNVNPWDARDNIRGGIAYLAGLLRLYDHPALALVAYNAGPQHADRVRAGQTVPYRETRRYLDAIRARYPLP